MGFVLTCNATLRKLMVEKERENGEIDWADLQKAWDAEYPNLVKAELHPTAPAPTAPPPAQSPLQAAQRMQQDEDVLPPSQIGRR